MAALKALWHYRHFIHNSIRNDLVSRFARSKMGGLWMIINPLAQVMIYALILSNVLAARLPGNQSHLAYAVYLVAGLSAWSLFSEMINRCTNLFIEKANLLKKISFPRITLPIIAVGSATLNYFLLLIAMLGIFLLLGHKITSSVLWLIPLTMILLTLALGIGLTLGVLNVFIRDIGHLLPIVLQVWFWFTPIVYPLTIIPENQRLLFHFNPLTSIVEAYHQVLVYGDAPQASSLIFPCIMATSLLLIGFFLFRKGSEEMVDVL